MTCTVCGERESKYVIIYFSRDRIFSEDICEPCLRDLIENMKLYEIIFLNKRGKPRYPPLTYIDRHLQSRECVLCGRMTKLSMEYGEVTRRLCIDCMMREIRRICGEYNLRLVYPVEGRV